MCLQEAITATTTLDDDDQSTVRRMLTYLYTLDYDDQDASEAVAMIVSQNTDGHVADSSSKPEVVDDAPIVHCKRMNNVRVYALAEKYNIPALKELAKAKFMGCEGPSNFTHHQELINAVFASTPDTDSGLRNTVVLACATSLHFEKSLEEEGLAPVIRDHGSLDLGILREFFKEHNAKLKNLNPELETTKRYANVETTKLDMALGHNAKLKGLNAELERKEAKGQFQSIRIER